MHPAKRYRIRPGRKVRLGRWDPAERCELARTDKTARASLDDLLPRIDRLQALLWAEHRHRVLLVLQGMDTAGKDATIRRVFEGVNPQGVSVARFGPPTPEEAAHDFLWRAHLKAPGHGEVVIFNRSHYEDVLIVRVHKLVPRSVWSRRYELINGFEKMLAENGTRILKFYLHISPDEQLARFKQRLDDPARHWKISDSDYVEREFWPKYIEAYEDVFAKTSTEWAPWYVIPANHKWFRDLAISAIVADTMAEMNLRFPPSQVDLTAIRRKYHAAKLEASTGRQSVGVRAV